MVTSLKEDFTILIYEKDKLLNSILYYQISNHNNSKVFVTDNKLEIFEALGEKNFNTYCRHIRMYVNTRTNCR